MLKESPMPTNRFAPVQKWRLRVSGPKEPPTNGSFAPCLRCDCEGWQGRPSAAVCRRPGCDHSFFAHDVFGEERCDGGARVGSMKVMCEPAHKYLDRSALPWHRSTI